MLDWEKYLERGEARDRLVIVLHGYARANEHMADVRRTVRVALKGADIFAPLLPFGEQRLCQEKAETIVVDLLDSVEAIAADRLQAGAEGYKEIIIVGHSMGAVLARKLAVVAFGEQKAKDGDVPAPFEPEFARFKSARTWSPLITRMVLLAGMNRGWSISSAMDWWSTVKFGVIEFIVEAIYGLRPTFFAIRRGAPFLVNTRLQWLALMNEDFGPRPAFVTIQLLGTTDDIVAPDDNVDFSIDQAGSHSSSFLYMDVPQSNHGNIIEMADAGPDDIADARKRRRERFLLAMLGSKEELIPKCISREQMGDLLPPPPDTKVTDVVFVIHGIRDKGYWTQKIARAVKRVGAAKERNVASCTESYGYFAMVPFLLQTVRQRKVEWLMDRYVETRARYPRATFHYVGHSNGTYLAAQALNDYIAARFSHVVFAGSVVRRDYDWLRLIDPKTHGSPRLAQVSKVLNYVATRDWVVAIFPKGVQPLKFFNLGSAGHDGFNQASDDGPVHEIRYIVGEHGAGHEEPHWDDIAQFVISGTPEPQRYPPLSERQSPVWKWAGWFSTLIFGGLVALALWIGWILLTSIFAAASGLAAGLWAIAFFLYALTVYLLITRF